MILNERKLENSRVELEVEVPIEKVEIEYKSVFEKIKNKVKVDGFRKGKAPLNVVEAKYKEHADQDVVYNLTRSMSYDAINEKELKPISELQFDYDGINRTGPFKFKAVFEVFPTVEIGKYKQIQAEEQVCKITNEDVNAEIDIVREKFAEVKKKDENGTVENDNIVNFKFKRIDNIDKSEIENTVFKSYSIIVGKSKDKYTLDKHIIGMKINDEKEVEINYPKDYQVSDLAGQKVKYLVVINEISNMNLPELNDEFAKKSNYDSIEEMRNKNREMIENYVEEKIKSDVRGKLIKAIVENSKYDIPDSMILNDMYRIFQRTQEKIGYNAENIEQFSSMLGIDAEEFKKKIRKEAEESVKTTITLSEISKKEEIKVSDEEYKAFLEKISIRNNTSVEELEKLINSNNTKKNVENDILVDKAFEFLYSNAKIKKLKPVSFEELMKEKVT